MFQKYVTYMRFFVGRKIDPEITRKGESPTKQRWVRNIQYMSCPSSAYTFKLKLYDIYWEISNFWGKKLRNSAHKSNKFSVKWR
jgi:hypothetical protein